MAIVPFVPRLEPVPIVATIETIESEEPVIQPTEPQPSISETPVVEAAPVSQPITTKQTVTPPSVQTDQTLSHKDLWAKTYQLVTSRTADHPTISKVTGQITSAVVNRLEADGTLFANMGLSGAINACIAHLGAMPDPTSIRVAIAREECGF